MKPNIIFKADKPVKPVCGLKYCYVPPHCVAYEKDKFVGMARVITDFATTFYIADVIVYVHMKKLLLLICFTFLTLSLYAHGITLTDHSKIKEQSSFTIMGEIDLRNQKDYSSQVKYRTLNHEGGMKVTVLEVLKNDVQNKNSGRWFYVLTTSPMWVQSGEWIKAYQKFLIFLPDDMPVFEFEE